jgi:hypothetical protein
MLDSFTTVAIAVLVAVIYPILRYSPVLKPPVPWVRTLPTCLLLASYAFALIITVRAFPDQSVRKDVIDTAVLIVGTGIIYMAFFLKVGWPLTRLEKEKLRADTQLEEEKVRADRAREIHEAEERARDAELQARMDALRDTPPPRQSTHPNLGPEAQKLKDDIDTLFKK